MSDFEEDTYSVIFSSLKHPIRRGILRMLASGPRSFSELQTAFRIESSHLTYHLDSLAHLVIKGEDGRYVLSSFGEAAVAMMHGVEEGPINVPFRLAFSRGALLALVMLAGFLYFQFLSIDNRFFLFFEFSSFVFLFFGAILLLRAYSDAHVRRRKIFVNIVALICIFLVLVAAYSLATLPRGGVWQTHHWEARDFSAVASRRSGPGSYVGSNYPYEFIYSANYAVGQVDALAFWGFGEGLMISADETLNLNGTLYIAFVFTAAPGVFYETRAVPVSFGNSSSSYADIDLLRLARWGSDFPYSGHRFRVEGYKIELWVQLWLDGEDAGSAINFTFHPVSDIYVYDYTVDSSLQNTAAILLCGIFVAIYAYVPFKALKPSLERKAMPRLNRFMLGFFKGQPTQKSFLKKCVKCGKDVPIASEQCPYCRAEQK
jgi:DNA-binding transcriptional ArsR family regulator